jgi:putative hydrolase of the HAD superfamily
MLSNIDDRYTKLIRDFGFYKPFEPCLLSCEMGLEKPDPKAYELLLKTINLPAEEIVFIDDKEENVEAAKAMGIDAILFTSEPQLRGELNKRGVLE